VWGALSYLTVDLWDGNFTEAFICTLIDCATNTDGVVTFEWDCIEHALYAAAVSHGINETQLRLYAQINYIIWILGGIDALNTMAATTAITEADCTFCAESWCYEWDTIADLLADGFGHPFDDPGSQVLVYEILGGLTITDARMDWSTSSGSGGDSGASIWGSADLDTRIALLAPLAALSGTLEYSDVVGTVCDGIAFGINAASGSGGTVDMTNFHIEATGTHPAWTHGRDCS